MKKDIAVLFFAIIYGTGTPTVFAVDAEYCLKTRITSSVSSSAEAQRENRRAMRSSIEISLGVHGAMAGALGYFLREDSCLKISDRVDEIISQSKKYLDKPEAIKNAIDRESLPLLIAEVELSTQTHLSASEKVEILTQIQNEIQFFRDQLPRERLLAQEIIPFIQKVTGLLKKTKWMHQALDLHC